MAQAKTMMTAFGEQLFNEIIDSNKDGQASLEEIEMVIFLRIEIGFYITL